MAGSEYIVTQRIDLDTSPADAKLRQFEERYREVSRHMGGSAPGGGAGPAPSAPTAAPLSTYAPGVNTTGGGAAPPPINHAAPSMAPAGRADSPAQAPARSDISSLLSAAALAQFAVAGIGAAGSVATANMQGRSIHWWDFAGMAGSGIGAGLGMLLSPAGAAAGAAIGGAAGGELQKFMGAKHEAGVMRLVNSSVGYVNAPWDSFVGTTAGQSAWRAMAPPGSGGLWQQFGAPALLERLANRYPGKKDAIAPLAEQLAGGIEADTSDMLNGSVIGNTYNPALAKAMALRSPASGFTYSTLFGTGPEQIELSTWLQDSQRKGGAAGTQSGIPGIYATRAANVLAGGGTSFAASTEFGKARSEANSLATAWHDFAETLKEAAKVSSSAARQYVAAKGAEASALGQAAAYGVQAATYSRSLGVQSELTVGQAQAAVVGRRHGSGAALPALQGMNDALTAEINDIAAQRAMALARGVPKATADREWRNAIAQNAVERLGVRSAMSSYSDSPALAGEYSTATHAYRMAALSPFYATNPLGAIDATINANAKRLTQMRSELNAPGLDNAARVQRQAQIYQVEEEQAGLNQARNFGWEGRIAEGNLNMPSRSSAYAGSYRDALLWGHSNRRFGAASFSAASANRAGGDWTPGGSDATNRPGDAFARGMAQVNITVELKDPSGTYKGQLAANGAARRALDTDVARVTLERQ